MKQELQEKDDKSQLEQLEQSNGQAVDNSAINNNNSKECSSKLPPAPTKSGSKGKNCLTDKSSGSSNPSQGNSTASHRQSRGTVRQAFQSYLCICQCY